MALRKAWYWFQKPTELLVAGTVEEEVEEVEEEPGEEVEEVAGSRSDEERLLLAGGRALAGLVTTPWCFM